MDLLNALRSFKNGWDFSLRNRLRLGFSVRHPLAVDIRFQREIREFLALFHWAARLREAELPHHFTLLDVGARNFCLAPMLDEFFGAQGYEPEIYGIEIDAYRRLSNLHTRRDYGDYYAAQARRALYYPGDFLDWQLEADLVLLLNPFVTPSPLLAWGLPLRHFRPERIFEHAAGRLAAKRGYLLVSSPTEAEAALVEEFAAKNFELVEKRIWFPASGSETPSVQNDPRFGRLFRHKRV